MIDFILLAILGIVVWMVASDGPWSAAIAFVSVLLSGLIAMNYFEPLANLLQSTVATTYDWQVRLDILAFFGIFSAGVFGLRTIGETLLPTYAEVHGLVYDAGRWGFAVLTGYLLMAIICMSLHLAPLPREFLGFTPERGNLLGMAPDRQWLALTQFISEKSMRHVRRDGRPIIFDGAEFPSNPDDPKTVQRWASFPLKYATRRQQFASGGAPVAQTSAPPPPSSPPPGQPNPNSGTGGF